MFLLFVQLIVPLILLCLLALPSDSRRLKVAQTGAVFLYLVGVHLAGLWLELPWWTAWILWLLFVIALLVGRGSPSPLEGTKLKRGALVGAWALFGAGSGWFAVTAVLAHLPPRQQIVNIASPLPPGRYLVVNGGNRSLTNAHFETLHPRTERQAAFRGQSFGVDIVGLTKFGRTSGDWQPSRPEAYAIFGTPVLAPCSGTVVARLDGRRDMPVPIADRQVMPGNHVVLRCGDVQLLLAHLRRGSVAVEAGQRVRMGERLGEVGNSGNTGTPHLHIHAQRPGRPGALFAAEPLPLRIEGRYLVRGDRL